MQQEIYLELGYVNKHKRARLPELKSRYRNCVRARVQLRKDGFKRLFCRDLLERQVKDRNVFFPFFSFPVNCVRNVFSSSFRFVFGLRLRLWSWSVLRVVYGLQFPKLAHFVMGPSHYVQFLFFNCYVR